MTTLLALLVGWACLGGLWVLCRFLERQDCRSVDTFQASRSVLASVIDRASPAGPVAGASAQAHVRVLERTTPRADPVAVAVAPPRSAPPAPVPAPTPPVLRFGDDGPAPEPSPQLPERSASGSPAPTRARTARRLARPVGAVAAAVAALFLLGSAGSAVVGGGRVLRESDVEAVPVERLGVDRPAEAAAGPEPEVTREDVVQPTPDGDGALTVPALGVRTELALTAREAVWLELRSGDRRGSVVWRGLLQPGQAYEGTLDAPAHVRIGNPGGLDARVDGRRVPLVGASPVDLVVTAPAAPPAA